MQKGLDDNGAGSAVDALLRRSQTPAAAGWCQIAIPLIGLRNRFEHRFPSTRAQFADRRARLNSHALLKRWFAADHDSKIYQGSHRVRARHRLWVLRGKNPEQLIASWHWLGAVEVGL